MQNRSYKADSLIAQQPGSVIDAQRGASTGKYPGYVAGVDLGGTNLRIALADMAGKLVAKTLYSTAGVHGPEGVIARIKDGIQELFKEIPAPRETLQAVGVGAPGITNIDSGVVIATSYLMGWRDVPLGAMLEDALKAPAIVDNDVNLAAVGEHWQGAAQEARDFVFIGIGTGVGASIVLNGVPFRGTHWAAGEIGYMLLPETKGVRSNPGEPGALEDLIGGEGIKAQWRKIWDAHKTKEPPDLNATQIFDLALTGEPLAQNLLQQTARILSHAIYNINLVLNCPLFVLGGGVGVHPALRDATKDMLAQLQMRGQPELATSLLGVDAQIVGALRQALDRAALPQPLSATRTGNTI